MYISIDTNHINLLILLMDASALYKYNTTSTTRDCEHDEPSHREAPELPVIFQDTGYFNIVLLPKMKNEKNAYVLKKS